MRSGTLADACEAALLAASEVAPPGSVALQVREKDLEGRALYDLCVKLREICTRCGAPMLVNDRIDIALAARADGVHLPSDSIGVAMARKLVGDGMLIGVSTHSPPDVAAAAKEGADFAVFGPIFDPISKSFALRARGKAGLDAACRAGGIPVYALGGITADRARDLMTDAGAGARAAGVAGIGAILGADSPADAMRAMLAALNSARR